MIWMGFYGWDGGYGWCWGNMDGVADIDSCWGGWQIQMRVVDMDEGGEYCSLFEKGGYYVLYQLCKDLFMSVLKMIS